MKKFILKIFLALVCVFAFLLLLLTYIDYAGISDAFYKKFRRHSETSLIIGTSRAAQGILPSVINESVTMDSIYSLPIYNFAFTLNDTPFGELYYSAIRKNLSEKESSKTNLYIVAVDPWALCIDTTDSFRGKEGYRENKGMLAKVPHYSRPNFEYLFHYCRPDEWLNSKHTNLHDDGWLEICIPMDSTTVQLRMNSKFDEYSHRLPLYSEYRMVWFQKTIELLKQSGDVVICRIPTSEWMMSLESDFFPDFDQQMQDLSNRYQISYFSFITNLNRFQTTDGNHLYKESGKNFTKELCDSIILYHSISEKVK